MADPDPHRHDDQVPILRLVLGVAALVAIVILVFFAVGYVLGRIFL